MPMVTIQVTREGSSPDRSAVTAEEKGLLGSEYYANNPVYPLGKTVGVINMDALSPYGPSRDFTISGSASAIVLVVGDGFVVPARSIGYLASWRLMNVRMRGMETLGSGSFSNISPTISRPRAW